MQRRSIPFSVAVLVFSSAMLAACSKGPEAGAPGMGAMPPMPVGTVVMAPGAVPVSFEYVGQTVGSKEVEVRGRVAGILDKKLYSEGSAVKAGQVLFEIDPAQLEAAAAAAAAEVAAQEANVAQALREAARLAPLAAEKAVSQRDLDNANSAEQIARAALLAAKARLQQVRLDLGYTKVVSPVSGVAGRALKSEGSLVTPGGDSLLTTVVQLDPMYVSFGRAQADQSGTERAIASGELVLPNKHFDVLALSDDGDILAKGGKINFVAPQVNGQTGTIENRATFANADGHLRAGQFVRVRLSGAVRPNALTVPQRAVLEGPQGKMVMVAAPDEKGGFVVQPRPVELGEWVTLEEQGASNKVWVVRKGLAAGDQVIVDNLPKLRPGAAVSPGAVSATPAASSAPAAAAR